MDKIKKIIWYVVCLVITTLCCVGIGFLLLNLIMRMPWFILSAILHILIILLLIAGVIVICGLAYVLYLWIVERIEK